MVVNNGVVNSGSRGGGGEIKPKHLWNVRVELFICGNAGEVHG